MTLQEARQQVNACERQITNTYSNLWGAAKSMGSSASQAASSKTIVSTLLPLIISLFGSILCIAYHSRWVVILIGVVLIILGIVIAYNTHQSAASVQKNVEQQVKYLNNTLDSNSRI